MPCLPQWVWRDVWGGRTCCDVPRETVKGAEELRKERPQEQEEHFMREGVALKEGQVRSEMFQESTGLPGDREEVGEVPAGFKAGTNLELTSRSSTPCPTHTSPQLLTTQTTPWGLWNPLPSSVSSNHTSHPTALPVWPTWLVCVCVNCRPR